MNLLNNWLNMLTKRPNKEAGVRQLMSYMSASSCKWGIWTNGNEIRYLYKDLRSKNQFKDF